MSGKLEGKVAFVTGAARGQGRSHAVSLAREGADIIAVDLCAPVESVSTYPPATAEDLAETASLVKALGRRVVVEPADVRERSQLKAILADAVTELGGLHIVVANAGICALGADAPIAAFVDSVTINFGGVVNAVEAALPHLGPGASIIATGSMASLIPGSVDSPASGPGGAGYSHAKRAVARFVHDLAFQLGPHSIRVNAIHPGNIATDMLLNDAMYKMFRPDLEAPTREDAEVGFRSMHRMPVACLEPQDISNAVVFLASDDARYVTGLQMKVDAGGVLSATTSGAPA
jgi:SDR family mycofactocin-dependent oxidoreductase